LSSKHRLAAAKGRASRPKARKKRA
jgi:hypothetical protein